ncbi:MAG: glycosyltransferase [Streptomycetaceae bacterium]|nr:glycosyltransferase [Streptomycetaceae bacterium]
MSGRTVSIVIPAYNCAKTLRACLASAYAQSHRPVEVVVVDDASTDATAVIAAEFDCRLIRLSVNGGVSAARNAGAAASAGEVLFFVDSDGALHPGAVAAALAELDAHPECGCVMGVYEPWPLIDDGPIEQYRALHTHWGMARITGETQTSSFALTAVPRAVYDTVGPFDESLRTAEDDDYSERLLPVCTIRVAPAVTGRHDDVDSLRTLLAEQFHRSQLLLFSVRNRYRRQSMRFNSTGGVLLAGLTAATLPLGLAWTPLWFVPLLCFAAFSVANPQLSAFAWRLRGPGFVVFFTAVHLLVNVALLAGLLWGLARVVTGADFGPRRRRAPSPAIQPNAVNPNPNRVERQASS